MNNTIVNFSNLDLIPQLLEKIDNLENEVYIIKQELKPKYDLTKRAGVRAYLGICDMTISAYINNGTFKENIHFKKEIKGKRIKIIFVEDGILAFKKQKDLK